MAGCLVVRHWPSLRLARCNPLLATGTPRFGEQAAGGRSRRVEGGFGRREAARRLESILSLAGERSRLELARSEDRSKLSPAGAGRNALSLERERELLAINRRSPNAGRFTHPRIRRRRILRSENHRGALPPVLPRTQARGARKRVEMAEGGRRTDREEETEKLRLDLRRQGVGGGEQTTVMPSEACRPALAPSWSATLLDWFPTDLASVYFPPRRGQKNDVAPVAFARDASRSDTRALAPRRRHSSLDPEEDVFFFPGVTLPRRKLVESSLTSIIG